MRLPAWIPFRRAPLRPAPSRSAATDLAVAATTFDDVAEPQDIALLATALTSLHDQMHEVINRNADGVNRAAIALRRETDLLLTLGISDAFAGKAGSYAQMALELANAGRGIDLQAQRHDITPADRAGLVARAMTLMLRAEMLMEHAKTLNRPNIQAALARQEQLVLGARASLVSSQS
jgi:hypothetical protein